VTGKEAIHLVRSASVSQVAEWIASDTTSATLRLVCWMRSREPDGWRGLLRDMGLLDPEPISKTERAGYLWRQDFWTDDAMARETGLRLTTIKSLRRTKYREATWSSRTDGHYRRAYHMVLT
jgi:hypothetical protein